MGKVVKCSLGKIIKTIKQKEYKQSFNITGEPCSVILIGTMEQLLDNQKMIKNGYWDEDFTFGEIKCYREVEFDYDEIFDKLNSKLEDYEIIGSHLIEKVMDLSGITGEDLDYCIDGVIELQLKEKEVYNNTFERLSKFIID